MSKTLIPVSGRSAAKDDQSAAPQRASRRKLLKYLGTLGAGGVLATRPLQAFAASVAHVMLPFENGERELVTFPQKRPLILLTSRPPQLETPFSVFNGGLITPNDAFFVRYHWSGIPTSIDPQTYRLRVGGKVNSPLELSLDELKRLADSSMVRVNYLGRSASIILAGEAKCC